jgi:hypothetical protein
VAELTNQPRERSQPINAPAWAQVIPIDAGQGDAPDWNSDEGRLQALMLAIDALMPGHHLSAGAIGAAASALEVGLGGFIAVLIQRFAEGTPLKPGTSAYNRAEFRNVVFVLHQLARTFNDGTKAPALVALYWFFSSAGVGPHPDRDLWRKKAAGFGAAELERFVLGYESWRSHLRNRMAQVRQALEPNNDLNARRRKSILGADPLIAMELQEDIPRQMRLARGKAR